MVYKGTLMFPTYNWDYCKGEPFDIARTPSRTGALGAMALRRSDFERTQHPIYSFAVWGVQKAYLCGLTNKKSFGWDSPFGVIDMMLLVNIDAQHSLTFAHHVEQILQVPWRWEKDFGGYSMYVRQDGVETDLFEFDRGFDKYGEFRLLDMAEVFHSIKQSILLNGGKITHTDSHSELEKKFDKLWPYCRSLTGLGSRVTHRMLSGIAPLETHEVSSGTKVYDWYVPKEWTYHQATIYGPDGRVWIDAKDNNLHVVGYSEPFYGELDKGELEKHLHIGPEAYPYAIPYVTSYYKPAWGFCISYNQHLQMKPGKYRVVMDTELKDGSMTYSDLVIPGKTDKEIWFSTYTCHPSMANNELSGPLALAFLAKKMLADEFDRRFTYRFIFVPETIGCLAYLSEHEEAIKKCIGGYEVTCCGSRAPLQYKRTRWGVHETDEVAEYLIHGLVRDYFPNRGADERHYNSPAIDLPIGCIMRSAPGEYPEYHTSMDNKSFISFENLQETIDTLYRIVQIWEGNRCFQSMYGHGEPMLGRRGLYEFPGQVTAMRWVLSRPCNLLQVAEDSGIPFEDIQRAAEILEKHGLIEEIGAE
jgi:aminopeptidase-like protein